MKEIFLSNGLTVQVDDDDYEHLNQWKWHAHKNKNTYYAIRVENGHKIKMHRLILNVPQGYITDHRDHNGLNNQKSNLRLCTISENNRNRTSSGSSKYLGVCVTTLGGKYKVIKAVIRFNKKQYYLGVFRTEEDAAMAYDIKAKELFGDFANPNFK